MSESKAHPADPLIGTLVNKRYRVVRKLGVGGMGRVYEAQHELIGKRVALKCLNAEFATNSSVVERFKREARAATAVGNDHIVDVTDLGDLPDGSPFIVMELLEGRELTSLINEGPMTLGRAVRIITQACDALSAAHGKGIVHRDMKPENIFLISRSGNQEFVKVLDFGVSKMLESSELSLSLTSTGMAMGTPKYMSPEQAQGLMSTDHRTDVYALGVILYRMLTGDVPFSAETFPMLIVAIVTRDAPLVRELRLDLPVAVEAVVQRALARDVNHRFQTVQELAFALAPFRNVEDPPRLAEPPERRKRLSDHPTVAGRGTPSPAEQTKIAPPTTLTVPGVAEPSTPPMEELAVTRVVSDAVTVLGSTQPTSPGDATRVESAIARGPVWMRPTTWGLAVLVVGALLAVLFGARGMGAHEPFTEGSSTSEAAGSGPRTPPPARVVGTPNRADASPEVRVRLRVVPTGARIFLDDREFPNPLDSQRPRSLEPVRVRMELDGYQTIDRMIVFDSDARLEITLSPNTERPSTGSAAGDRSTPTRVHRSPRPPSSGVPMGASPTQMDGFRDTFD